MAQSITISWTKDELVGYISNLSAYVAQTLSLSGDVAFDINTLTEDNEQTFLDIKMAEGVNALVPYFSRIIEDNSDVINDDDLGITFTPRIEGGSYSKAELSHIKTLCRKIVASYVLADWYSVKGIAAMNTYFTTQLAQSGAELAIVLDRFVRPVRRASVSIGRVTCHNKPNKDHTHVNNKSDFILVWGTANGEPLPNGEYDVDFYTDGEVVRSVNSLNSLIVKPIEGIDNKVRIVFDFADGEHFANGILSYTMRGDVQDADFPDGYRHFELEGKTDIEIWDGPSDSDKVSATYIPSYMKLNFSDLTEEDIALLQAPSIETAREIATEIAGTAAEAALKQGDYASEQGDYAKEQGDYAQTWGNHAMEQGDYAKVKGDYAKEQGDYAKTAKEQIEAAESLRVNAEKSRITNESEREQKEINRNSNELDRQAKESERSSAEAQRVANEEQRQANTTEAISNANTAADRANAIVDDIINIVADCENITYEDFCGKMINGELKAGRLYRITDYITVVGGLDDVTSAGHPFDLIVLATGPSAYSEECWAAHAEREGARYFDNCDLSRWKVWWRAMPESGEYEWVTNAPNHKGVIYRLIDENNNDLPYDFKNILVNGEYTLSLKTYDGFSDASVHTDVDKIYRAYDISPMYNITMKGWYEEWEGSWRFPYNIVRNYDLVGINDGCYYGYTCRDIFMDYGCSNNVIEDGDTIHLGKYCQDNSILGSDSCNGFAFNITLGEQCFGNKIGTGGDGSGGDIRDITIGDNCAANIIEDMVYTITMTNSGSNTIAGESDQVELYSAGNCYVGNGSNNCVVRNCGSVMTPGWVSGVTYQNMNDQNLDTDTRIIGNCYVTQDSNGNVVVKSPDDKGVYYLDIDRKDLIDLKTFDIEVQYTPYAALKDAVSRGQVVILPYDKGNHAIGGYVANVTVDDFVYVTVQTEESAYTLEGIIYKDSDLVEFLGSSLQSASLMEVAGLVNDANNDIGNLYEAKQDKLKDGENIKTINGQSILGEGDITIVGDGGASVHYLDFDVADLESLLAEYDEWETPPYFEGDYYSLKEAVEKGQIIVMPKDKNNHSLGGYVVGTTMGIANGMGFVEFSMQVGKFIYFLRAGGIDLEDDSYYVVNAPAAHRRSIDELVTDNDVDEALGSLDGKYAKLLNNTGYVRTSGCLYEDVGGWLFLLPTEDTDDMRDSVDYVLATEEYVDQKLGDVNAVLENIING